MGERGLLLRFSGRKLLLVNAAQASAARTARINKRFTVGFTNKRRPPASWPTPQNLLSFFTLQQHRGRILEY